MVTSHDFPLFPFHIMGRAEVSDSGDFGSAFGVCLNLQVHVWDELEDVL